MISGPGISLALTWDDVRQSAIASHHDMEIARISVDDAIAGQQSASAGFKPKVNGSLGRSRSILANPNATSDSYTASVTASQSLFAGFQDTAKVEQASHQKRGAELSVLEASTKLRSTLRKIFDRGIYLQELIKVTDRTTARREENVRIVALRYEGGRENKSSALKTEASFLQAKADDAQARLALSLVKKDLARQIQRVISENEPLSGTLPEQSSATKVSTQDSHESPTLERSKENILAADAATKVARSRWLPDLSLEASAGKTGETLPINATRYTASLVLTVPLYNPSTSPEVTSSVLAHKKSELELAKATQDAKVAQDQAAANIENARNDLEVALKLLEANRLQAEVYRQRYTLGLATFSDWDAVERDFILSEKSVLDARHTLADAITDLEESHYRRLEDVSP